MLGRLVRSKDVSIYILFPNIVPGGNEFVSLIDLQHMRWMDRVFMPSIIELYASHVT